MKSAFTLIELIIALAVTIVLASVGVARYSSFIRQQDFLSGAQQITGCVQKGQQLAVTGGVTSTISGGGSQPIRYVVVNVFTQGGDTGLSCEIDGYPYVPGDTTLSLMDKTKIGGNNLLSLVSNVNNTTMSGEFSVVFGVLEHGLPLDYSTDGVHSAAPATAVTNRLGLPASFQILTPSGDQVTATVNIGQTGTPITLTNVKNG